MIEVSLAGFLSLGRRGLYERTGFILYGAAVAAGRDPYLYAEVGIPDTLDGRFDAICLHVILVIRRLSREPEPGPSLAQAVFDAMFSDMDVNLREMGVGDMGVGRRNRAMWEALHGRAAAYQAAWENEEKLIIALTRNIWRGTEPPMGAPAALYRLTRAQDATLSKQDMASLEAGRISFLPVRLAIGGVYQHDNA